MRRRLLRELVAHAMFSAGRLQENQMGLMNNLRAALRRPSRQDAEFDYLNQSTSPVDLEMRQREIDRGRFRHLSRRG